MLIRHGEITELDRIMEVYAAGKAYMERSGNYSQWNNGYPSRELVTEDIQKQQCYVCVEEGDIHGVFVFFIGKDAAYEIIEKGRWKNDKEYGVIHRIASDGQVKGIMKACTDYCKSIISNLRGDTHEDNKTMQHVLEKNGFERCGIIHLEDGSPRIAYQYCGNKQLDPATGYKQTTRLETTGLNPFLPLGIYIPDGEPKVFGDRIYLYGSKDLFEGGYCCHKFHVYSAPIDNLCDWTDHGPVLASTNDYVNEGIEASVPWSEGLLWAPDVVCKDGVYYFYFCLSDGTEGVATSLSPAGPFENCRQITMDGKPIEGIDPSVLEDNGIFYYTWGQGDVRMAELNEDMCSLKPETFHPSVISHNDGQQGFHEGSSLRKVGKKFCIVYSSEWKEEYPNRGAAPTKMDYAVSDNPYGPYTRMGTIIENEGIDPESWNNHGSIVKIGEEWFVFYHGSTNHVKYSRRARVERLIVDEEKGLIQEADITTNGFLEKVSPKLLTEPSFACRFTNGAYVTESEDGTFPMVHITNGASAMFRYIDFSQMKNPVITIKYRAMESCLLYIYVGSLKNEPAAVLELPVSREEGEIPTISCTSTTLHLDGISQPEDIRGSELYFVFKGEDGKELCELVAMNFEE